MKRAAKTVSGITCVRRSRPSGQRQHGRQHLQHESTVPRAHLSALRRAVHHGVGGCGGLGEHASRTRRNRPGYVAFTAPLQGKKLCSSRLTVASSPLPSRAAAPTRTTQKPKKAPPPPPGPPPAHLCRKPARQSLVAEAPAPPEPSSGRDAGCEAVREDGQETLKGDSSANDGACKPKPSVSAKRKIPSTRSTTCPVPLHPFGEDIWQ